MKCVTKRLLCCVVAGLLTTSGCETLPDAKSPASKWSLDDLPWAGDGTPEYQVPVQMIAVWTDSVFNPPGQIPMRGFGGRIYFYNNMSQTVPVNGTLTVYVFNDAKTSGDMSKPDGKFVFTPEQFTKHFSESELGASYSVWVPWDRLGGYEARLTLIPVFRDASGQVVRGEPARNVLPGKKYLSERQRRGFYEPSTAPALQPGQVMPAGYEYKPPVPQSTLKSTTIIVPPSLREQMRANEENQRQTVAPPLKTSSAPATHPQPLVAPPGINAALQPQAAPATHNQPLHGPPAVSPALHYSRPHRESIQRASPQSSLGRTGYSGIAPRNTVSANARAWPVPQLQRPQQDRFARSQFRVPTSPGSQPALGHGPKPQYPTKPPWNPASSPAPNYPQAGQWPVRGSAAPSY